MKVMSDLFCSGSSNDDEGKRLGLQRLFEPEININSRNIHFSLSHCLQMVLSNLIVWSLLCLLACNLIGCENVSYIYIMI